jgi:hypothetical protein
MLSASFSSICIDRSMDVEAGADISAIIASGNVFSRAVAVTARILLVNVSKT